MARNVDLTDRLGLDDRPTITVKGTVLTVDNGAENVLMVLGMTDDGMSPKDVIKAAKLMIMPESQEALQDLHLSFEDYGTLVSTAVDLVMGVEDSPKEETPATT